LRVRLGLGLDEGVLDRLGLVLGEDDLVLLLLRLLSELEFQDELLRERFESEFVLVAGVSLVRVRLGSVRVLLLLLFVLLLLFTLFSRVRVRLGVVLVLSVGLPPVVLVLKSVLRRTGIVLLLLLVIPGRPPSSLLLFPRVRVVGLLSAKVVRPVLYRGP
jgi:hypothetical protein